MTPKSRSKSKNGVDRVAQDAVEEGRAVLRAAAGCLDRLARELDEAFAAAARRILACPGLLITTGIGKAGHVAQKVSATFASTGTTSFFLHPTEAIHGDLGRVGKADVVLAFSNSGSSAELLRLIQPLRSIGSGVIVVSGNRDAPLSREADVCLCYGDVEDAGHLGLAPTTSTTVMLALGDALAMAVLKARGFSPAEFARFHPAGALGRSLMRVEDVMRRAEACPRTVRETRLCDALHLMSAAPGRPGAVSIVDAAGRLIGFYTDGDFRRNMEAAQDGGDFAFLRQPIGDFMTHDPKCVERHRLVSEAMRMMRESKIDQLPVVDEAGGLAGLLDVQDLLDVRVLG